MPCSLIIFRTSAADLDILESPKKNIKTTLFTKKQNHCNKTPTAEIVPTSGTIAGEALCHICVKVGLTMRAPEWGE
jgi:hypothetical protein